MSSTDFPRTAQRSCGTIRLRTPLSAAQPQPNARGLKTALVTSIPLCRAALRRVKDFEFDTKPSATVVPPDYGKPQNDSVPIYFCLAFFCQTCFSLRCFCQRFFCTFLSPHFSALPDFGLDSCLILAEILETGVSNRGNIAAWNARKPLILWELTGFGAGDGNRTHVASLEGWSSTTELHPRASPSILATALALSIHHRVPLPAG